MLLLLPIVFLAFYFGTLEETAAASETATQLALDFFPPKEVYSRFCPFELYYKYMRTDFFRETMFLFSQAVGKARTAALSDGIELLNLASHRTLESGTAWQFVERLLLTRDTLYRGGPKVLNDLASQELVNVRYLEVDTSIPIEAIEAILTQITGSALNLVTTLLVDNNTLESIDWSQYNMFRQSCLPSIAPRLRSWALRIEHDGIIHRELDIASQIMVEGRLESILPDFTSRLENLEELRLPALFVRHLMPKPGRKSIAAFVPQLPRLKRLITMGRPPTDVVHRGSVDPDGLEHIFFCGEILFESESMGDNRVALNCFWDFPQVIDSSLIACTRPCTLLHMFVGLTRCTPKNLRSFLESSGAPFDVNERLDGGQPAIHVAIKRKHGDAVSILLEAGSDITLRDVSSSILRNSHAHNAVTLAVQVSTPQVVATLFEHAAYANLIDRNNGRGTPCLFRDGRGATVISIAAMRTDADGLEVLKWLVGSDQLLKYSLHVDDSSADTGNTPLHNCRSRDALRVLVDAGADLGARNVEGELPITTMIKSNANQRISEDSHVSIAQLMLELGSPTPQPGSPELRGLLLSVCSSTLSTSALELVLSFTDTKMDLNHCDENQLTPLFKAIRHGGLDAVSLLLAKGADATASVLYRGEVVSYIEVCVEMHRSGVSLPKLMKLIVLLCSHGCPLKTPEKPDETVHISPILRDFIEKANVESVTDELRTLDGFMELISLYEGDKGMFAVASALISRNRHVYICELLNNRILNCCPAVFAETSLLSLAIMRGNSSVFDWLMENKSSLELFSSGCIHPLHAVLLADEGVGDDQRASMVERLVSHGWRCNYGDITADLSKLSVELFPSTVLLYSSLPSEETLLEAASLPPTIGGVEEVSKDEETSLITSTDEFSQDAATNFGPASSLPTTPSHNIRRRSARIATKDASHGKDSETELKPPAKKRTKRT